MPQDEDTLSKIVQNLTTAQTYLSKAVSLVAKYQNAVDPIPLGTTRGTNTAIHSLQMWAEYLAEHGPTLRGDLDTATNLSLTRSGYDRTQAWTNPMTYMADDALPDDAVMRIKGLSNGVGRPPVIYFLWNQRWSVLPKFGVGPTKPENMPEPVTLLGVIQPPISSHPIDPAYGDEQPINWDEIPRLINDEPVRFASIDAWDEHWAPQLDILAATETKPTDEQKQELRVTLPDGAEPNASIAIAYRAAVERSREASQSPVWPFDALGGPEMPPDISETPVEPHGRPTR